MGKILVIAEKPSVALDISRVLGAKTKGDGCYIGEEYIVSWALGHLTELWEPEDYDQKYKKWKMGDLPIIPNKIMLKIAGRTKKQFTILKKLMNDNDVDSLICATDSGREGELIFRYIYELAGCNKPFMRLWISSMTDAAIKQGFKDIKPGAEYDNLYYSARCRSHADWLVGINASRAYTLKYNTLLSIGRVQTPTLFILTQRQEEINNFVPQKYWQIKADFEKYQGLWHTADLKENKITDKEKAESIHEKIKSSQGEIKDIIQEKKSQPPGLLYDLTLLQREANRFYGYSASATLEIAQDLYEKRKIITYPRTDSQYLPSDMIPKITPTINILKTGPYETYANYILELEKLPLGKRIIDDSKITDHHAIIPTLKKPNLDALSSKERNIFDLIAKKFLAAFYPSYIYNVTKIITVAEEENFITQGITVLQLGFKELYKDVETKNKEEDVVLPDVNKGEVYSVTATKLIAKKTVPPKPYNEEHLLAAMENAGRFTENEELKERLKESGIGTPATRAAIIERLITVGYVKRSGKALIPTEKGMTLIKTVPHELKSPETTGKWEKGLSSISKGKMEEGRFMESIGKYVKYIIESAQKADSTIKFPTEAQRAAKGTSLGKCPLCGEGPVLENTKAFYCGHWKSGCKFTIWKNSLESGGIMLNESIIKALLKDRRAEVKIDLKGEERPVSIVLDMTKLPPLQIVTNSITEKEGQ